MLRCVFGSEQRPMVWLPVCTPAGCLLQSRPAKQWETHKLHAHTPLHLIQSRLFTAGLQCWFTVTEANNLCLPPSGWMRWAGRTERWRGCFQELGSVRLRECVCVCFAVCLVWFGRIRQMWSLLLVWCTNPLLSSSINPLSFTGSSVQMYKWVYNKLTQTHTQS